MSRNKASNGSSAGATRAERAQLKEQRKNAQREMDEKRQNSINERLEILKKHIDPQKIYEVMNPYGDDELVLCEAIDMVKFMIDGKPIIILTGDMTMISTGFMLPTKLNKENNAVTMFEKTAICLLDHKGKLAYGLCTLEQKGKDKEPSINKIVNLSCTSANDLNLPVEDCKIIGKIMQIIRKPAPAKAE